MLFFIYSAAVVGSVLDRRRRVKMTEPKFIKLNAIINTFFSHYKVFLYPLFALVIFYGCFVFLFLGNVGILKDIQYSITHDNKGRVSTYCSILLHKNSESQTLRMNLDNNYKLSWTYYGLAKSSLDGKDLYYPNKLDDKKRNELIKSNCE